MLRGLDEGSLVNTREGTVYPDDTAHTHQAYGAPSDTAMIKVHPSGTAHAIYHSPVCDPPYVSDAYDASSGRCVNRHGVRIYTPLTVRYATHTHIIYIYGVYLTERRVCQQARWPTPGKATGATSR